MRLRRKPHVVVVFGGDPATYQSSQATGRWVCAWLPRERYQVTPVHVMPDGQWQVPLGSLPQSGSVERMMEHLFTPEAGALRSMSPGQALQRLLKRPVDALMTVLRGRGGDDGALHYMGQSLRVPVIGSGAPVCSLTSHKQVCAQHCQDIAAGPRTLQFSAQAPLPQVLERVTDEFMTPLFVKPAVTEGSFGTEYIESPGELAAAVGRVQRLGSDVLVQSQARGAEFVLTLVETPKGVAMLPPTRVQPKRSHYYDHLSKLHPDRVQLTTDKHADEPLVRQAEEIARAVFDRLGCRGYASFDFLVDGDGVSLLEVNTIPTVTAATPLLPQLISAGLPPTVFLDRLVQQALEEESF